MIKKRQQDREAHPAEIPHLCLFPEGTTSNNTTLLPFKRGAFSEGYSIQPIGLKYSSANFQPAHDVIPIVEHAWLLCSQLQNNLDVYIFPPFKPTDYLYATHKDKCTETKGEKWEIYSWAIRDVMS